MQDMMKIFKKICKANGIRLMSYEKADNLLKEINHKDFADSTTGFCIVMPTENGADKGIIFYDDTVSSAEMNYTIAHELGHILDKHTTKRLREKPNSSNSKISDCYYRELLADMFAIMFLVLSSVKDDIA